MTSGMRVMGCVGTVVAAPATVGAGGQDGNGAVVTWGGQVVGPELRCGLAADAVGTYHSLGVRAPNKTTWGTDLRSVERRARGPSPRVLIWALKDFRGDLNRGARGDFADIDPFVRLRTGP